MESASLKRAEALLATLYGARAQAVSRRLETLVDACAERLGTRRRPAPSAPPGLGEVMLISYGDSIRTEGEAPLATLGRFLDRHARGAVTAVHILPMFPSTSDDGFSVSDYRKVDPQLGDWEDVAELARGYGLMFDAVVNHASVSNPWFRAFLRGEAPYDRFFAKAREGADYSSVVRPRALPLFTPFETSRGREPVWTTFSADQADLDFSEPEVLLAVLDTLLFYAERGARYLRLDAVGFVWKEEGTSCLNLPGAHAIVKLARLALDAAGSGTRIITETNVPHAENIAYFGAGDEAGLVYQFPLPPLVLHAFLSGSAERLGTWIASLGATALPPGCAWFNFLASHDGIGLRPTEGILDAAERDALVRATLERGGRVGYRSAADGSRSPYELNINYLDALSPPEADDGGRADRTCSAHAILLALDGMPGIYVHSLLGSRNWSAGVEESGIPRRINREKLDLAALEAELDADGLRARVSRRLLALIRVRRDLPAFAPGSPQTVIALDPRVLALARGAPGARVLALANVSDDALTLETPWGAYDAISGESVDSTCVRLAPFQARWLLESAPGASDGATRQAAGAYAAFRGGEDRGEPGSAS